MISAKLAKDMLDFLWNNHHILSEHVNLEMMPPDRLDALVAQKVLVRPFRISTSLANQGYFVSAWSLWEFYSNGLCDSLPIQLARSKKESCVEWVKRSLEANGKEFDDHGWFAGANALRNLIAHYCGRAVGVRAERLLAQARTVFPDLQLYQDGFVLVDHPHIAELQFRVENFIEDIA